MTSETKGGATKHTPGPDFTVHLVALRNAIDMVQPIADYRGNFGALHAVCALDGAIAVVLADIAPFVDHAAARAWAPEMAGILTSLVDQWNQASGAPHRTIDQARALLARLDG